MRENFAGGWNVEKSTSDRISAVRKTTAVTRTRLPTGTACRTDEAGCALTAHGQGCLVARFSSGVRWRDVATRCSRFYISMVLPPTCIRSCLLSARLFRSSLAWVVGHKTSSHPNTVTAGTLLPSLMAPTREGSAMAAQAETAAVCPKILSRPTDFPGCAH